MVLAGILIGSQNPQAGMAAATSGMASGIDAQLGYSREQEREADRQGMRILANAALNPEGMPDFFTVLNDDSRYRRSPPPFLSTHPLTEARIADARAIAAEIKPQKRFESPDYAYIRARAQLLEADSRDDALAAFQARMDAAPSPGERYGLALALIETGEPARGAEHLQTLRAAQGENALLHSGLEFIS
jgi:predicted Zn-dependent protease